MVVLVLKQPCFDLGLESIDVDIHVYSLKQPWFSLRKTSMGKIWDLVISIELVLKQPWFEHLGSIMT